ncbi:MAG: hypothetical protein LBH98_06165 [Chitinispirillales bacterium]|jgi:hypothetical protein|nr:hypothetical protein [Chitinispirillales bacterium]
MEEEKEENTKTYMIVGYLIILFTIFGFLSMFAVFLYSHYQKVGVIYCEFPYIGDLKFDDPFTVNGNKVGIIKGITSNEPNRTVLTINLKSPVTVHEGYNLFIGDVGIMGERVVCIENGPQDAPVISPADTLKGKYYPGISDMLGKIQDLRDLLDACIDFVYKISHGTDSSKSIIEWVNNAENNIDKFSYATQKIMISWDKDIPEIIKKTYDFSEDFDSNLTYLREKLLDIIKNIDTVIDDCDTLLTKICEIENTINDAKNFVLAIDTINMNSINQKISDLRYEINNIYNNALKLRLRLVKDRSKK